MAGMRLAKNFVDFSQPIFFIFGKTFISRVVQAYYMQCGPYVHIAAILTVRYGLHIAGNLG